MGTQTSNQCLADSLLPQDSIGVSAPLTHVFIHQTYWFLPKSKKMFGLMEGNKDCDAQMLMHE